jgi:hypothetical protein
MLTEARHRWPLGLRHTQGERGSHVGLAECGLVSLAVLFFGLQPIFEPISPRFQFNFLVTILHNN